MLARVTRALALAVAVVAVTLAITMTAVEPTSAPLAPANAPAVRLPVAQPTSELRWTLVTPTPTLDNSEADDD
jgi:hypothetical protein